MKKPTKVIISTNHTGKVKKFFFIVKINKLVLTGTDKERNQIRYASILITNFFFPFVDLKKDVLLFTKKS